MASFDLPAILGYIKQNTNQEQLYYVGHSQGTMIAFAEFSSNQEVAKSVRKFFALGPVAYLGNMKSPLKYLADLVPELKVFSLLSLLNQTTRALLFMIKTKAYHEDRQLCHQELPQN